MTEAAVEAVATPEQEEAAFASGFAGARGKNEPSPPDAGEEKKPEAKPEEKAAPAESEAGTGDAAAVKAVADMTPAEIRAALEESRAATARLAEENRKNFSQYGEVNRRMLELQKKLDASVAPLQVTAEDLKEVDDELPGMSGAMATALTRILGRAGAVKASKDAEAAKAEAQQQGKDFDPKAFFTEQIAPALAEQEARANQRAEMRIVKSIHRDFDVVVKSEEFSKWLGTLAPERRKEVLESEDAFVASDAVTEFKAAKTAAEKAANRNKTRLEAAVSPQGTGGLPPASTNDDEAEFAAGFKKVAKKA